MTKILNYIAKGKGIGAWLLLALSFVVMAYFVVRIRPDYPQIASYAQQITDYFLPISVENGEVTSPRDTIKSIDLLENDDPAKQDKHFWLVLDTTTETLSAFDLDEGVYMTKKYVYVVDNKEVRRSALEGTYEIEKKDYTDFYAMCLKIGMVFAYIVIFVGFFVVSFLLVLFYALVAGLAAKITKTAVSFDVKMRLSSVLFCVLWIFSWLLGLLGWELPTLLFFLLMIGGQILGLKKLPN